MGSTLIPICNSQPFSEINRHLAEDILSRLKVINFRRATDPDGIIDTEDWKYYIDYNERKQPFRIEYESGYCHSPTIYPRISEIGTFYRYYVIYENFKNEWFQNYRKELYSIVKMLGATEVIYLNDTTSILGPVFFDLVCEGVPYEEVKQTLINKLGQPVKDFSKLDNESLDYENINEFFLDEFLDLKS